MHAWESGGTATSWNTLYVAVRELPPFTSIPNQRKCRISEDPQTIMKYVPSLTAGFKSSAR